MSVPACTKCIVARMKRAKLLKCTARQTFWPMCLRSSDVTSTATST